MTGNDVPLDVLYDRKVQQLEHCQRERDALAEALKMVEWEETGDSLYCPWCDQTYFTYVALAHKDDCPRQAALAMLD